MWTNLLSVLIAIYLLYRLLKYWIVDPWRIHRHYSSQGIPGRYIPIVGEVLNVRRAIQLGDPLGHAMRMAQRFGHYRHESFGPIARLVISDPMLIKGVLKTNVQCYHKANLMRLILGTLLGCDNLLMAEDEIHSHHRRLIAPVFQHQNLNSMISLMTQITSNLLDQWTVNYHQAKNQGKDFLLDMQHEMARLTLDIVTGCVFGSGLMKDDQVRNIIYNNVTTTLKDVEHRIFTMIALIPLINQLPIPSKRRIERSKSDVKIVIQKIIEQRRKGLTKSACKGPDLLDLILSAHGDEKTSRFNDEELYQEALTFVIAGHETTSNLMVWTIRNLCQNPDVYQQLESEVDAILNDDDEEEKEDDGEKNHEITPSKLSLLTYTEAVLKESLRIDQPVPSIVRTAIEDNTLMTIDGKEIRVKKGSDVMIDIFTLHHSDKYWNDPWKFDPSRFDQRHHDTYLPFSAGSRSCIGQNFAMLEAKIMLAMIVKRFHFELVPGQKHTPEIVITMRPKYGMWMKVTPRHLKSS